MANNWPMFLKKISNHFNGKVNIVAHSKGGIDSQTALVHFGAHSYVNNIITLSTPFHGTALADLAYSAPCKMAYETTREIRFRNRIIANGKHESFSENNRFKSKIFLKNTYYTAAGTEWGPVFSASWFGGIYLSKVGGPNDGQVSVSSAQLPYGSQLFVAPLTHENMHQGSAVFEKINPTLQKKMLIVYNHFLR